MTLLDKGLKYNLNHKSKHWLSNTALEAEAAITSLPTGEQEHVRYQVAHNLQNYINSTAESIQALVGT